MGQRLDVDWSAEDITDEGLLDLLNHVAKQLTGLSLHEHNNGQLLVFTDRKGAIRHVVSNLDENNWGCFCAEAMDGECAATLYARARLDLAIKEAE